MHALYGVVAMCEDLPDVAFFVIEVETVHDEIVSVAEVDFGGGVGDFAFPGLQRMALMIDHDTCRGLALSALCTGRDNMRIQKPASITKPVWL